MWKAESNLGLFICSFKWLLARVKEQDPKKVAEFMTENNLSSHMLIFRDAPSSYQPISPEDREELLRQWNAWQERLTAEGKLQQGQPLASMGRLISSANGRLIDGPFAESKEAIGGFFLLTVADLEAAIEIAKQCPGLPFGLTVEVRPMAQNCPTLRGEGAAGVQELQQAESNS